MFLLSSHPTPFSTVKSRRRLLKVGHCPGKLFATLHQFSRQECLLEELSLEGSSLQSGTPPPRYSDGAPRGCCGLVVAVHLPIPPAPWPLARAELGPSLPGSPLLLRRRAAHWGFVWGFFGGRVSSAVVKHHHSQDLVMVAPRWEVNVRCCVLLLPTREDDVRSLRQSIF